MDGCLKARAFGEASRDSTEKQAGTAGLAEVVGLIGTLEVAEAVRIVGAVRTPRMWRGRGDTF